MPRNPHQDRGPGFADLIEEAVHLLRRYPRELAGYYLGTGPFAVGLLYFWAYATWFAPPDGEVAAGGLLLAVLFGWMKAGQHRFARRLLARRLGEEPPAWAWRDWTEEMAAQFRLQASGIVLVPLAAVFAVPFGWIYCYYQTALVLPAPSSGGTAARRHLAWEQMQLWPAQNHWGLAVLAGLWLMVFLNIAAAFYTVPVLATRWLGLKTVFALSGWSYGNTTYLALITVLTHLLVDPLIKTFYLLRVFHGQARRTGADLRLTLGHEKSLRSRLTAGLVLLLLGGLLLAAPRARAEEPAPAAPLTIPVPVLDRALDHVLEQPDFRWRLRPLPAPPQKEKEGIIAGFARSTFAIIGQIGRTIYHWIQGIRQWAEDLFPAGDDAGKDKAAAGKAGARNPLDWMAMLQLVSYVLLLLVAGLLIFVLWKVWQHNRVRLPPAAPAPAPAGVPDLRDENIVASRLPAEGWLELARQQMAAGEWRLALRALFLATLAQHAHEGLLALAAFKTNLDYEAELRRRAHGRGPVVEEFRGRRREFEAVWYGAEPASDALVHRWLQQMEGSA